MTGMLRFMALAAALLAAACDARAWQPTGSLRELYDDGLLPLLRPGVRMASFSSYDRTGGNNDGFSGEYSRLREENGDSVIAEMAGPGCIYRLWTTHAVGEEDGLLDRRGEHIRVYLDGSAEPALDVPLQSLFDNSLERFPKPLAGRGIGGFYSYIPIPYRKSCKVVIEGLGVRFYQLNYATFPTDAGVETFRMGMTGGEREMLGRAVALWNDPPGALKNTGTPVEIPVAHQPAGKEPAPFSHTLRTDRPMLVHGMTLVGADAEALRRTRIEIDCGAKTGPVSLPLDWFFGQPLNAGPFVSLLCGETGGVCYNRVPFVFTGKCTLRLHGILPVGAVLTLFQSPAPEPPEAYGALAVQCNESLPAAPGAHHPLLRASGGGHLAGVLLATEGPHGLPFWLEGDDRWTIDGDLRIHGTGSEDYFNCGWYALPGRLNGPAALPSHGFPVYGTTVNTMRAAAYRWHFSDCVPFENSIDCVIEHGEANRHIADYRSAAYWYAGR